MHPVLLLAILASLTAVSGVPLVVDGAPTAVIVLPADATPIAVYAAEELAEHIGKASGTRPDILNEPLSPPPGLNAVYVGATQAAQDAGIHPETLAGEESVLRTVDGNLFIVGNDGPGDPLSFSNTRSGTLWGVYEVLERYLGVRWLWPGELGTHIPHARDISIPPLDETVTPRFLVS